MKAIRGAITVEKDSPEQIREAVRELLKMPVNFQHVYMWETLLVHFVQN